MINCYFICCLFTANVLRNLLFCILHFIKAEGIVKASSEEESALEVWLI